MNYYHTCEHCETDILIPVTTAKNTIVECDIPDECPECGEPLDSIDVTQSIHDFVETNGVTRKELDEPKEVE